MGVPAFDNEQPFGRASHAAAAVICRTEKGNLHAGLLYREDNTTNVIHLGWEDQLSKKWEWPKLWVVPDLEPERLESIGGLCRRIWKCFEETKRFPYGLRYGGSKFEFATGKVRLANGALGLSCSTFILAALSSCGLDLIQEASWPVRTDEDQTFLDVVRKIASPDVFLRVSKEVNSGVQRIRPEEVVSACTLSASSAPFNFDSISTPSNQLVTTIDDRAAKMKKNAEKRRRKG